MKTVISITRVAFTFIGTVVGAGFASGQEILQFFTKYGSIALYTIAISSLLFIWLGTKLLLLAHDLKVTTYAELNIVIFGHRVGSIISLCTLIILLGSVSVMLAGSGTLLHEQLHISYFAGLVITLLLAYFVLVRGIQAIMNINTVVVPLMLLCCLILVIMTWQSPVPYHEMVSHQVHSIKMVVAAPFLYTAFNLAMAQAVIVPLGATIRDRSILLSGGIFGGVGIGLLLYASHYVLSTKMPLIMFEQMPLASLMKTLGTVSQYGYACILFSEMFTTLVGNTFGLALQLHTKLQISLSRVFLFTLLITFVISHVGFKQLLSLLYPIFGVVSLGWLFMIAMYRFSK